MTYRIQRSVSTDAVVFVLGGEMDSDHVAQLRELLAIDGDCRVLLDLEDVTLVDRAAVQFLARVESEGVRIVNCPEYVKSWIAAENASHEENPMTDPSMNFTDDRFTSADGLKIAFRSWRPQSQPRGVVAIVPGFNSHSGYYTWVAEQLVAAGLAVYAVDLRGRGKSDGERFYVEKFADYVSDVTAFVHAREIAGAGRAGVPARPQRRRRRGLPLRARASGGARGADLRELRVPGAGARFRAGRAQGAEPRRAACARAASQERGLLARSAAWSRR